MLSTIEHLVLLDLLGSPAPTIMQWYHETGWLFNEMKRADERLRASGVVKRASGGEWFSPLSFGGTIEDDQVPVSPCSGSDQALSLTWAVIVYRERRQCATRHPVSLPVGMAYHQGTFRALGRTRVLGANQGPQDDASALDLPTMRRWNLILRLFTLEYLGLDPTGNLERAERSEEPWQSRHELVSGSCLRDVASGTGK